MRNGPEIIIHYTDKSFYNQKRHGYKNGWHGMSARPEFYSGRGAIVTDLDSVNLEMIYDGVKNEYGNEAAGRFVQFVYDLEKLSATAFLNAFYQFVSQGCNYKAKPHRKADDVDVGPDNGGRLATGMATIAGVMFGSSDRDETEQIRGPFLRKHDQEYKIDPKRQRPTVTCWGYYQ